MPENETKLSRPLVVGRRRDGRKCYDAAVKRELVEACLRPGVSVARLALEHGMNAELLRKWMGRYRRESILETSISSRSAFIPVVAESVACGSTGIVLEITLPHGLRAHIRNITSAEVAVLLNALSDKPCSVSTSR